MALGTVNVSSSKPQSAQDIGGVPYHGLATDLNTVMESGEFGFYEFDGSTKNTPYTQGLSIDDTGIVMNLPKDAEGYSQQIAYFSGESVPCFRYKNNNISGSISAWKVLFVPISGGVMSGELTSPGLHISPALCGGYIYGEENQLCIAAGNPETGALTYFIIKADGLYVGGYKVYHQGFTPTAEDVGAVPLGGCCMEGSLVAQAAQVDADYTTPQVRNAIILPEGEDPTGGNDGDICVKYVV